MADKDYEQLSAVMDDEQSLDDQLLSRLENDADTSAAWQRYHLIRTVMQDGHAGQVGDDMIARVHAQLADEPVVLAPRHRRHHQKPAWVRQVVGMAIAAGVAVVAVLAVQPEDVHTVPADVLASAPAPVPQEAVRPVSGERLSRAVEARLSAYLVNHNEYSSMAGVQSLPAYTRIISSTPGERVSD